MTAQTKPSKSNEKKIKLRIDPALGQWPVRFRADHQQIYPFGPGNRTDCNGEKIRHAHHPYRPECIPAEKDTQLSYRRI